MVIRRNAYATRTLGEMGEVPFSAHGESGCDCCTSWTVARRSSEHSLIVLDDESMVTGIGVMEK